MNPDALVGLFTLVGTIVGALITGFFNYMQERKADKRDCAQFIRQKRCELYEQMASLTFDFVKDSNEGYGIRDQSKKIFEFFSTQMPNIELYASKKVREKLFDLYSCYTGYLENGGYCGFHTKFSNQCDEVISVMKAELGIID